MKVILIGPYPPPLGGISVHIKRMKGFLENQKIEAVIYNENNSKDSKSLGIKQTGSLKSFLFKIPFLKGDIIHFHSVRKEVRLPLGLYKIFNKNIILTIHGESLCEQLSSSTQLVKRLLIWSLKRIDRIICVNPKTKEDLLNYGFSASRIEVIPAYLNPIQDQQDEKMIPEEVWKFINNSGFLICANGAVKLHNAIDLYGIDMLIKLIGGLRDKGFHAKLLVTVLGTAKQSSAEKKYYLKLKQQVDKLNLGSSIYFYEVENTEFFPILRKSRLFIRPTSKDGYGVSIAEAVSLKVPSIASDVCRRPEGSILFKSRDDEDLMEKVEDVILNYDYYKQKLEQVNNSDYGMKLLEVYKSVLEGEKN